MLCKNVILFNISEGAWGKIIGLEVLGTDGSGGTRSGLISDRHCGPVSTANNSQIFLQVEPRC